MTTVERYTSNTIFFLFVAFVLAPWATGLLDFTWVFFTDNCLTSIPWHADNNWRMSVAFFWPFGWMIAFVMFCVWEG